MTACTIRINYSWLLSLFCRQKPITDGVTANGLLLYLPPISLHSSNKYPRDNEREKKKKNRDKLFEKEKKPYVALRTWRRRRDAGNVAKDSPKPGAGLCSRKRVKRKEEEGGGRQRGWEDRQKVKGREPNAYLLTSDVCSCY